MTASLIRKELLQHWWALLLIGLVSLLGIGWILVLTVIQSQAGSYLFALRLHATLLAFCALILGNRLVVAEYSARTQIFLESLPLPRARIVLVKYGIGLVVILFCAASGLGVAMLMGLRTEVYTAQFVGILTARYLCFTVFVYSFFFGMGFLGRYRFAAYALIVAGVALVIKTRDIQLHELAPIQLVGATFPFEREIYPVADLVITGGLSLAFLLLAVVLASAREGSVSSLLGERMSYRDKISLTALIFGMLAAFFVIDERKAKEPYKMEGFTAGRARLSEVTVSPDASPAGELADRLSRDLDEMAEFLGLTKVPPVFIIERPDLDPDQFEAGLLDDAEGIIIRTPFNHPEWRYAACLERVSGDVLESTSNRRAMKENSFWVIDGFSLYWPHRGDPDAPLDKDLHLILRALYGTEKVRLETPEDLHRWFSHQNAVGHQITAGMGWSMLRVLEQTAGPDSAQAFMRSVLGTEAPRNLLVTLRDLQNPVERRFKTTTGLELAAFMDTWNAELAEWRADLAEPLAEIPRLEGELVFEKDPGGGTSQARFRFAPPEGSSPDTLKRPVLLYGETAPFRTGVSEVLRKRRPLSPDESSEGWLVETWGSGTGLAWTFAADQPQLRCRIITGWRHDHIP